MAQALLRDKIQGTAPASTPGDYLSPAAELENVVTYVRDIFAIAKRAKQPHEIDMLASLARISGTYPADKLAELKKADMPDAFLRLTYHKCRDAESWITEIHSTMGIDRTWDIDLDGAVKIPPGMEAAISDQVRGSMMQQAITTAQASGQPVDPEAIIQEAKLQEEDIKKEIIQRVRAVAEERAANMETLILSQLETGGYEKAFKACINDLSQFKACIMKGPIYRKKMVAVRFDDAGQAVIAPEIVAEFERVSPFNWYPSPNSTDVDDGPSIELEALQRKDFTKLIGVPGYKEEAIRKILATYGDSGFNEAVAITSERDYLEKQDNTTQTTDKVQKIDSLNYWGEVPGHLLLEWGMSAKDIPDPVIDYQVNVKIVNDICFKAVLNPDLLGKKPYGVSSFKKSNDSQWGEAPADLMVDIQNGANQAVRALEYNIAVASGAIGQCNIDMLADGETPDWYPGKMYETVSKNLTTRAVDFENIPMHADELMRVIDFWLRRADDIVVPSFSANGAVGADKTLGGRAMRIEAAGRNIKLAVENVDKDIIVRAITMLFNNNMRFINDPSIKGALKVKARGTAAQLREGQKALELNAVRQGLFSEEKAIMGEKGMAALLFETLKANKLDPTRLIPNYAEISRAPSKPAVKADSPVEAAQARKFDAEAVKLKTASILDTAKAEAAEAGSQLSEYQAFTDRLAVTQQPATEQAAP